MKKVLVTGASGLLGANTILELLNNGYHVNAVVRDKNKYVLEDHKHVSLFEGSLDDIDIIKNAVNGCEYIIHAAAETSQSIIDYALYHKTNVELTRILYETSVIHNVKRIIHVSTSNAFGYGTLHQLGDESAPSKKPFSNSLYVQSKIASQDLALTFSDKLDIIIVNPTFLIGPYDQKPSSGRIVLHGFGKRVIFYPPGGKNFVDARDAAKAIVASLLYGKNKGSYILASENLTYKQFFEKLIVLSPRKPILIKIPGILLITLGVIGNLLKKLGVNNDITLTNMRILCVKNYYSNSKAKNELNIEFNTIDKAIADTVEWFKSKGRLIN